MRAACVVLQYFFFFQAEDGIRDYKVTGVQTCALPISPTRRSTRAASSAPSSKWCAGAELTESSDPRRALLLSLLRTGLERVDGRRCVRAALTEPATIAAAAAPGHVWLAAIGKAAESMAHGAHEALGAAIERTLLITRSEEHTSELQSPCNLVCRLLLDKNNQRAHVDLSRALRSYHAVQRLP